MVQFAPAARLVPQVLAKTNWDALAPVTLMLLIVNRDVPVLVKVTVCKLLQVPTVVVPNAMLVGDRVTEVGPATPVPVNAMLCGESMALSTMVMAADNAPVDVG